MPEREWGFGRTGIQGGKVMDMESWFAPAMEMGRLVWEYSIAGQGEKEELERKIRNCAFISRLNTMQSYSGVDFLRGIAQEEKVNFIKRDFFLNPAIPSLRGTGEPYYQMTYHRHDYMEFIFVLRGSYVQSINGVLHRHKAGDVCMLNPNVIHRDEVSGPEDRVLFMGLSAGFLKGELARFFAPHPDIAAFMDNQFGRMDQQYILFHREDFSPVERLLEQIVEEDERKLPGHHLVIKGYLVRLFGLLSENNSYTCHYQSRNEIEENLLAEILKFMQEHLASVNRKDLAAFFHFNPDYLNRFLLRRTGENYSTHLRSMRLQAAAEQLKSTDKSVNEIIGELGFSNKGHFNKMFCEKYGMLPGAYREEWRS